jgi:hypothetical protein
MNNKFYIEAPTNLPEDPMVPSVFLAGGITGCGPWQWELAEMVLAAADHLEKPLYVVNPRRENFPIDDPNAALAQITWEHNHLRRANAISMWFTNTTLQPICLYELGAWSMTDKPLFVGVQPGYAREQDVSIQTALARPDVTIVDNLDDLATHIIHWRMDY